jgi:phosphatidylglycerophosphate synthase
MSEIRLNRIFSRPLTRFLLKTPLTPNQITLLSLVFGILAGYFFSRGEYLYSLAAAASYQLAVVLDNCDGEVARAKNMRSKLGGWLDIGSDLITDIALFLGIALGMKRQGAPGPVDLFLVLCLTGAAAHFLLVIAEKLKGFGPAVFETPHPEKGQRNNPLLHVFDALREGDASWFVIFFAAADRVPMLLWVGGVYMQLLWLGALFMNFRWTFRGRTV